MSPAILVFSKWKYIKTESFGPGEEWLALLEYDGIPYHLVLIRLLEYGERGCKKNECPQNIYDAYKHNPDDCDAIKEAFHHCEALFWPHIAADHERHVKKKSTADDHCGHPKDATSVVKLRLLTGDNKLQAVTHDLQFDYPHDDPVDNPFPDILRAFTKEEVNQLAEIEPEILKVDIDGPQYCLKTVHRANQDSFIRELNILATLPEHRNIIYLQGVAVVDDETVEAMVLTFIEGELLSNVTQITATQARKRKSEISKAVRFLHENQTVWGDIKAANVMVDSKTDSICLVDFGGGRTKGWVDPELYETREGDIQGVSHLEEIIDNLAVNP